MSPALRLPASTTELQWFYTREELAQSPSIRAGMTVEQELHNRTRAIKRLYILRNYQSVHQPVISTAATFIHRFYMRETIQDYDPVITAVAAFFLACKSEEEPRPIKPLVQYLLEASRNRHIRVERINKPETDLPEFKRLRAKVLAYEETILRSLCYDLTVRNPHWYIVNTAQRVWTGEVAETGQRVARAAWGFLNDSLSLPLCLLFQPQHIAAAALVLACAHLDLPLPPDPGSLAEQQALHELAIQEAEEGEEPPPFEPKSRWMELLEVRPEDLRDPIMAMLGGYKLAMDPFVADEGKQLAAKAIALLSELAPSSTTPAPVQASPASTTPQDAMAVDPPA